MSERHKIAYIINSFNRGGKELILLNVLDMTDTTRFEPMLFAAKGGDLIPEITNQKVYVGTQSGNILRSLPALWKMIAQERPNVVWCIAPGVMGFAGRLFARIFRTPVTIISLHGRQGEHVMDWPNRLITRLTTQRVVTTSQAFGRILLQEGIPQRLLQIIYNGIDTSLFQPSDDRGFYKQRLLSVDPAWPVIGTVSNLLPYKAQHVLLKAVPSILTEYPDALFVIAGDGPSRPELEALCHQLGIREHVYFLGLRKDIPELMRLFDVPVGLSDHTLGIEVPVAAVALGACIVEKHIMLSRSVPGPDSAFSLEPHEFKAMVDAVRTVEKALGSVQFGVSEHERASFVFRRSLFVVQDVKAGETFTSENIRSIRPGHGMAPKFLNQVLGRRASHDIAKGTPLDWELLAED